MKKMIVPVLLLLFLCACTRASEKNRTDIAVYGEPQAVISMPDTQAGFDAPDGQTTKQENGIPEDLSIKNDLNTQSERETVLTQQELPTAADPEPGPEEVSGGPADGNAVTYAPGDYYVVTATGLTIRRDHSENSAAVCSVKFDTKLTVSEVYYEKTAKAGWRYWGKTTWSGKRGWIPLHYTLTGAAHDHINRLAGENGEALIATEEDWAFFEAYFSSVLNLWDEFDCTAMTADDVFNLLRNDAFFVDGYEMLFGESVVKNMLGKPDPLQRFTSESGFAGYQIIEREKLDWIFRNIFNVQPKEISAEMKKNFYLYDEKYYSGLPEPAPEPTCVYRVESFSRCADGKYIISAYCQYINDSAGRPIRRISVLAMLKNIEGKRVWSLFFIV